MPDKNPPAFPPGDFFVRKTHVAGTLWTGQAMDRLPLLISVFSHRPWFSCQFFCEEHIRANTPVKTNTPNGAGGGQTSAPDFCIFASPPGSPVGGFFAKNTCWQAVRKRQTPQTAQAAARLTSLIPASSSGPADREDFCGQCASDSPIWIAAVTSAEMVYHRAALPLADAGGILPGQLQSGGISV